jgi:SnoaL-like domain
MALPEQALTEQDRIDIGDLINLHGHLTDAGELDQAGDLFTEDVTYDLGDFGLGSLHGTAGPRPSVRPRWPWVRPTRSVTTSPTS